MEISSLASDAGLVLLAAAGLIATLIAIARDTQIRRQSIGPAIP
jgi:hypothetical protein